MADASGLASEECEPCRGGVPPLAGDALTQLSRELGDGWRVVDGRRLARRFAFVDFVSALAFVNQIGALAEEQGHHPDLLLRWGSVDVELFTHTVDGLTRADFVLAAKIDALRSGPSAAEPDAH